MSHWSTHRGIRDKREEGSKPHSVIDIAFALCVFEQSTVQALLLTFEILNFVQGNVTKLYTNFTFSFNFWGTSPPPRPPTGALPLNAARVTSVLQTPWRGPLFDNIPDPLL